MTKNAYRPHATVKRLAFQNRNLRRNLRIQQDEGNRLGRMNADLQRRLAHKHEVMVEAETVVNSALKKMVEELARYMAVKVREKNPDPVIAHVAYRAAQVYLDRLMQGWSVSQMTPDSLRFYMSQVMEGGGIRLDFELESFRRSMVLSDDDIRLSRRYPVSKDDGLDPGDYKVDILSHRQYNDRISSLIFA